MTIQKQISEIIRIAEWNWDYVQGAAPFFACFMLCGYYLYKKKSERLKIVFVYPMIFYILLLSNIFFQWFLLEKMDFYTRSHRFFWIFQIPLILAFVIVDLLEKESNKKTRGCLVIIFLFGIMIFGKSVYEEPHYLTENIYKVEDDVLEVSEALHQIDSREKLKVFINDVHMNYTIRQYDPSLCLQWGTYTFEDMVEDENLEEILTNDNESIPWDKAVVGYFCKHYEVDFEYLNSILKQSDFDYMILNYKEENLKQIECLELKESTSNYYLYKVMK